MTSLTEYLWFTTKKQRDLLNITEQIEAIVGVQAFARASVW